LNAGARLSLAEPDWLIWLYETRTIPLDSRNVFAI